MLTTLDRDFCLSLFVIRYRATEASRIAGLMDVVKRYSANWTVGPLDFSGHARVISYRNQGSVRQYPVFGVWSYSQLALLYS